MSHSTADNCRSQPLKVAVDIGHSKADHGATSARGKKEYEFNRRFVLEMIEDHVQHRKIKFFVINPSGNKISLKARTDQAHRQNADVFVSIHHDSVNKKYLKKWQDNGKTRIHADAFRGFSVFVSRENPEFSASLKLARDIARNFKIKGFIQTLHHAEPIPGEDRELLDWGLGVYNAPFGVLRRAKIPSVLVELGVIIHRDEEDLLNLAKTRQKLAAGLVQALEQTCN